MGGGRVTGGPGQLDLVASVLEETFESASRVNALKSPAEKWIPVE